ncbi:oxidoreductase alpha (molybdopterin) subunit [Nitritalea halalkaliphila LW7]|uniref:Oxidoreductase alpha (Molybdopterin) subunit n=1 Tax=Nitritalea halalkaliphila LW7 TaxID=1189621 RepID=I5C3T6_9BACT|nr:FdhF/YdeP family oxidoreductase [Nitritalea halalkaliphila]EIM76488.1 oxidoreductase alpha (molybdopterin) subunit [Nitritalea halalkaliphila LW7]
MAVTEKNIPAAQPPEKFEKIRLEKPSTSAAGFMGVKVAIEHVVSEMGVGGLATLFKLNQKNGFDCPGCAWPDPDEKRSFLAEYCENGAKAVAEEATLKRADPEFFKKHSVHALTQWTDYELGKSGRITHPMILRPGASHYEPIQWDEAFQLIADKLKSLPSPDRAIFYTSGRASNEAAFLYQLMIRMYGTNNMPDCSNMCHESSGYALSTTVGIGKGSVTLEDFQHADVILIAGQNPGTNHPRMLSALEEAKAKGIKIVSINPLPEVGLMNFKNPQGISMLTGAPLTDIFLQVRINGDVSLFKALLKLMWDREQEQPGSVFDHDFIQEKTEGFEALNADIASYDAEALAADSGVPFHLVQETAELLCSKKNIIACWAMGLTQHKNSVDNIRELVNILLLKGSIGKKGAGTCPVRGHSNVQGDRTMGIWEKPKPEFLDSLHRVFGFEPPRAHGHDTVSAIEAMYAGEADVFFGLGGNFLSATPDTNYTAKALMNCDLTVHVSTKPNRSHLIHGKTALILPCLGRSEEDMQASGPQFVTVENSMGVVHMSRGDRKPASAALLSEPAIVAGLAKKLLGSEKVDWVKMVQNYDHIRDAIEAVIPGFDSYNKRVRKPGGFYLPNGSRTGDFTTPDRKAHFTINKAQELRLADDQYLMMTIRSHDQFNTTIYGLNDRYRGVNNERRVIFMNPRDMEKAGLKTKDVVNLVGHYEDEKRFAYKFLVIPFDIPERCTATYFPETNVLVPIRSKADHSHTPTSKLVIISIEKAKS